MTCLDGLAAWLTLGFAGVGVLAVIVVAALAWHCYLVVRG